MKKRYFFPVFIFLLALYLFWGPLFPWSPIKFGFRKIESSMATIFMKDFDGDSIVYRLDDIIREEEKFHDLTFRKKFKIIILGKESNMKRYLPWLKGSGYSVKLGIVNVIYIGPNARDSQYGTGVFLKHEMSHLLIHQNTSSTENNFEMQKQGWLTEGVATYFGGPHYWDKSKFIKFWKENGLGFNALYEENPLEMGDDRFMLKYTYYRFFIEFLINTYGLEKFQYYLKRYCDTPGRYKMLFPEVYHEDLNEILMKFDAYMNLAPNL